MIHRRAAATLAALVAAVSVFAYPSTAAADGGAQQCTSGTWQRKDTGLGTLLGFAQAHVMSEGAGVRVAVVGTGVDEENPQLRGAVVPGASVVGKNLDPRADLSGIGTAVAGIIAARKVQSSAVIGVAPRASVVPIRDDGVDPASKGNQQSLQATPDTIAAGIEAAIRLHSRVIVFTQATNTNPADGKLKAAVADAVKHDIVVVAASASTSTGNGPNPTASYPADYPGVIAVTDTDATGAIESDAIPGTHVSVAAIGDGVYGTAPRSGNCAVSGATAAVAQVAGVAALLRAQHPTMTASQVIVRIEQTATRAHDASRADDVGWGLVDPVAALSMSVPAGEAYGPVGKPPGAAPARYLAVPDPAAAGDRHRTEHEIAWVVLAVCVLVCGLIAAAGFLLSRRRANNAAAAA